MEMSLSFYLKQPWVPFFLFLLLLMKPSIGQCQSTENVDSPEARSKAVAREIMLSAANCALVSLDEEGKARIRTMDPFAPDSNFVVWLGTSATSRKLSQIEKNPSVTLYYLTSDNSSYVSMYGEAFLVNDSTAKEQYWRKKWEDFYPDRKKDYVLIKVVPKLIEVLSFKEGLYVDTVNWQPLSITF